MRWSKKQTAAVGLVVAGLVVVSLVQRWSQARLKDENQSLEQLGESLRGDNERLSNRLAQAGRTPSGQGSASNELARLREEVELLRGQTNQLKRQLATAANGESQAAASPEEQALPADYPRTAGDAAKAIFEALKAGDAKRCLADFHARGETKEMIDRGLDMCVTNEEGKNALEGVELVSVGEPTNSRSGMNFPPNQWLVPCRMRLPGGREVEKEMLVGQDPGTQRWYFLGGMMQ